MIKDWIIKDWIIQDWLSIAKLDWMMNQSQRRAHLGWYAEGDWVWSFPPLWRPVATCGCCESTHCFTAISRNCCEAIYTLLQWRMYGFLKLPEAAVNQLLMVWNLEEVAMKPFAHSYKEYSWFWKLPRGCVTPLLMVWNLQEVAVKPFTYFYIEILMFLEASGGCCESIIDGLEFPRSCCAAINTFTKKY